MPFWHKELAQLIRLVLYNEATGADVREVARAIGSDRRIGIQIFRFGPGFRWKLQKRYSKSCILSRYFVPEVADFWEGR